MYLTRHQAAGRAFWALDGRTLPEGFDLRLLMQIDGGRVQDYLRALPVGQEIAEARLLAPIELDQEVWAAGVTYHRSREARKAESGVGDVYQRVYDAERPELFHKAIGRRVVGDEANIRVRRDSVWSVPEPELCVLFNSRLEVVAYCAGNDVSSRDIEGENPLYLPQAKVYDGSCALGPGLMVLGPGKRESISSLAVRLIISRGGREVFNDVSSTSGMKRTVEDLGEYLGRELAFPDGVFLMTGTGLVPPDDFALRLGDEVRVVVGQLNLVNLVGR